MEHFDLLRDLLILFGFATLVAVLLQRARQSTIVAYLLTGMLVGPSGLQLISNREAIELMAEIGVVLLLFSIGIEFSLEKLLRMRKLVLGAGIRQVLLTIALTLGVAVPLGLGWRQGIFWGFLIATSSTAIVLKLLIDRQELESLHGRAILGVLLFQDLCVVPMMAVLPALTAPTGAIALKVLLALGKALLIGGLILFAARYFFPALWKYIVQLRNKEIFIIATIFFSLGTAWVSSAVGLSLAMGAFLAGLALSESEYAHQILSEILPFRDSFNSLFFISVGMLLNLGFAREHWVMVGALAAGIFGLKLITGTGSVLTMGFPARMSLLVGLGLAQVGEFSFILLRQGTQLQLVTQDQYQAFLAAAVVTMILTPTVIQVSPLLATRLPELRGLRRFFPEPSEPELETEAMPLHDHVIICGYGLNGQLVAKVLRQVGVPHLVLEVNPEIVRQAAAQGEPIFFGDSTKQEILEKAGAGRARAIVYAISDPFVLARAISNARILNPALNIIVRTTRVRDAEGLERVGASQTVAAENQAADEIICRVLGLYGKPRGEAFQQIQLARASEEPARVP
ncbi:MAG: cation:proton antiporter [Acidobacteria bacterium]|nr:cation:proton antiporter [Acidobacteriota bacterium]